MLQTLPLFLASRNFLEVCFPLGSHTLFFLLLTFSQLFISNSFSPFFPFPVIVPPMIALATFFLQRPVLLPASIKINREAVWQRCSVLVACRQRSTACCSRCSKSRRPRSPCSIRPLTAATETLGFHRRSVGISCTKLCWITAVSAHKNPAQHTPLKTTLDTFEWDNEWSKCRSTDGAFNVSMLHKYDSVTKTQISCKGSSHFDVCSTIWFLLWVQRVLFWGGGSAGLSTPINPATHQELYSGIYYALIGLYQLQCQGKIVNHSSTMSQNGQNRSYLCSLSRSVQGMLSVPSQQILLIFIHSYFRLYKFPLSCVPFFPSSSPPPSLLLSPSQPSGCAPHSCHGNDIVSHLCNVMSY